MVASSVHPREDKLADNGEDLSLRQGCLRQEVRNQIAVFAVYGGVLTEFLQGFARIFHSDFTNKTLRFNQFSEGRCFE